MKNKYFILLLLLTSLNAVSDIVFETDFTEDVGYSITNAGLIDLVNTPQGWDGARATGNSAIEVIANKGKGGAKPALKLAWDPDAGQPVVSLYKHLTGNKNTGYSELYIRYHVLLPENFKAGDGVSDVPYWKWGRLWQNTDLAPANVDNTWTENRVDSFYAVWNFGGTIFYGLDMNVSLGANSGSNLSQGSAGGEQYFLDYYNGPGGFSTKDGHFQSVGNGDWDIDFDDNKGFLKNKNQKWHTIEYHIKLASSDTANNGIWTVWYDGVEQNWTRLRALYGADPDQLGNGIQTSKNGSGFNFFVFFDNMAVWNKDWDLSGVDGFIYVNDVVISTDRIGHEYIIGAPNPPTNLIIQ